MPLPADYKSQIKSHIADLRNVGGPRGGSITAALFLQEFVGVSFFGMARRNLLTWMNRKGSMGAY